MSLLYVILAVLFFGLLIGVHELGHFAAAKACGVRVNEFAIGMGPALFKKKKGETEYSLRLVPMGGYCAMAGEDEASDDPRAFTNQKPLKRAIILVAGSFMNFLLGFIMVLLIYAPAEGFVSPEIVGFMEGCPYESTEGFQVGDRFHSINGRRVYLNHNVSDFLAQGDGSYDFVLIRDGKRVRLDDYQLTKIAYEGEEGLRFGFYFGGFEEANFGSTLRYSWNSTMEFVRMVWMGLEQLFSGQVGVKDMSGPVGIVDMMAETGEQSQSVQDALLNIMYFCAFIAVNLAVMNMLPIPALDGGRVFLLIVTWIIEKLSGKKLDPKYEGYIHAAGMILLLALMAFVMFNDIVRIVTK